MRDGHLLVDQVVLGQQDVGGGAARHPVRARTVRTGGGDLAPRRWPQGRQDGVEQLDLA